MKHLSEWHTCDRCGIEIEYNYSTIINTKTQKTSYSLGICGVLLNSKTSTEEKNYYLCPKCRKEFEEWMKNEHDSSN